MKILRNLLRAPATMRAPPQPLISVIGATGTGKSQLAVELALALNGEVVNADAMQLYRGLPIITNKIADNECKGVPHHLLGFLGTHDVWQVGRFVTEAEKTINDIRRRGRLPILVGGTHYYVQSLLFPHAPESDDAPQGLGLPPAPIDLAQKYPILDAPTPQLYDALKAIDPAIAVRWHPNDRRKIRRSLEIYYSSGCKQTASEFYAAQRAAKQHHQQQPADSGAGHQPKYHSLVFWVHAEQEVLRSRLDARVDKMIEAGMWHEIEEIEKLYRTLDHNNGANSVDLNSGIWQSIGFKEFLPYLDLRAAGSAVETEMESARAAAIENTKTGTRQYARSQVRWIRIKFLNALRSAAGEEESTRNIFLLDSTNIPQFEEKVVRPGVAIARDFLAGRQLPDALALSGLARTCLTPQRDYDISQRPDLWVRHTCDTCNVVATSEHEWACHMQSARHKKRVVGAKKRKEVDEFLRKRATN